MKKMTLSDWLESDYIPKINEICLCVDTQDIRLGDGKNKWQQLTADNFNQIFNHFPTKEEILALPTDSYFTVIPTGNIDDVDVTTCYITTRWRPNTLRYEKDSEKTVYVCPINSRGNEICITDFGIRPTYGNPTNDRWESIEAIAEANSNIIDNLRLEYGSTIRFPAGHFWFARPIDWSAGKGQYHIIGTNNTSFAHKSMAGGTWLHFYNLSNGAIALKTCQGTVKDINIAGDPAQYTCTCDRSQAKNKDTIDNTFTETIEVKATGLYSTGGAVIQNVMVCDFYYGMDCPTSNTQITDIVFQRCHYGLTLGCDCKAFNIHGANIMTLLKCNGSISSASGVRGDSVGEHLVEISNGGSISLFDLDADFCMGSVVKIGGDKSSGIVSNLSIHNAHGRHAVRQVYPTGDTPASLTNDIVTEVGVISVCNGYTLQGAIVTTNQGYGGSPFDEAMDDWKTPTMLLTAQQGSKVDNVQIITSLDAGGMDNLIDWCPTVVKSFATTPDVCKVRVTTADGNVTYTLNNGVVDISKDQQDIDLSGVVKTVNSITPDESGNVTISFSDPIKMDGINTIDELRDYGDRSEKYVLDDGYIYSYRVSKIIPKGSLISDNKLLKAEDFPSSWTNPNTNEVEDLTILLADGDEEYRYQINKGGYIENRMLKSISNVLTSTKDEYAWLTLPVTCNQMNYNPSRTPYVTGLIPIKKGDIIRIANWGILRAMGANRPTIAFYDSEKRRNQKWSSPGTSDNEPNSIFNTILNSIIGVDSEGNDIYGNYTYIKGTDKIDTNMGTLTNVTFCIDQAMVHHPSDGEDYSDGVAYMAFMFYADPTIGQPDLGDLIVTVNEEIVYATETTYEYDWVSTGELYEKPDYLSMIAELEARIQALENK